MRFCQVLPMIKEIIKKTPVVRSLARAIMAMTVEQRRKNFDSGRYWESRYRKGKNSGPGSYSRLAAYKAEFLNDFVERHDIQSVIEFGCGDGAQLQLLKFPEYIGVDVSLTVLDHTTKMFAGDTSKRFMLLQDFDGSQADLSMSLDVIYHLVEDKVFEAHMRQLFDAAKSFVIIYSSNIDDRSVSAHVRNRKFTDWVATNTDAELVLHDANPYPFSVSDPDETSPADFFVFKVR